VVQAKEIAPILGRFAAEALCYAHQVHDTEVHMRLILLLLTALSFPALAQVYKWTDADGNVHFGNQPPPGQSEEVKIRASSPGDMGASQKEKLVSSDSAESTVVTENAPETAFVRARESANRNACNLARLELESAERMLTLAQSQGAYNFVLKRRAQTVEHWRDRVELHCRPTE